MRMFIRNLMVLGLVAWFWCSPCLCKITKTFTCKNIYGVMFTVIGESHKKDSIEQFNNLVCKPESFFYLLEYPNGSDMGISDILKQKLLILNLWHRYPVKTILIDASVADGYLPTIHSMEELFKDYNFEDVSDFFENIGDLNVAQIESLFPPFEWDIVKSIFEYKCLFNSNPDLSVSRLKKLKEVYGWQTISSILRNLPNAIVFRNELFVEAIEEFSFENQAICVVGERHVEGMHDLLKRSEKIAFTGPLINV